MKIQEVNTYFVRPRWGFVEILTDDGYSGWGEAVLEGHAGAVLSCVQEMKEYLALCLQGESTIMKRKEMLSKKQEMLRESIRELENSIDYIDWKQNFYDEVLSGKRPYVSNLICLKEETD